MNTVTIPGISDAIVAERGYTRVQSERQLSAYSQTLTERQRQIPGLLIPVYRLGNQVPYEHILRPDSPRIGFDGKYVKYEWPQGITNCLDILPRYQEALADPSIPVWATEGSKKADALASVFGDNIVPISINGVWGWKRRGKDTASHPLDDLDQIVWDGRSVILAFDNDVTRKTEVQEALRAFARHLKSRGAIVRVLVLPWDGAKLGVDDALAAGMSPTTMLGLIREIHELPLPNIAPMQRRYLLEDEIDTLRPPTWLIKRIIPAAEVTMVSGPGDAGKTFIVTDMMKRTSQHYPVLYIAAEDAPGIRIRKRAWELHNESPKNGNFMMWADALDLFDSASVDSFITEVQPLGLRMITIDTLSRCLGGADENSNTDMAIVMANCERIAHLTGAAVIIIHHTTKDGQMFRGASAMMNNTYGHLAVSRDDDLIKFQIGRIKNTPEQPSRYFKLVTVPLPDIIDDEGAPMSSAVILPADRVSSGDTLTRNQVKMLESLQLMTDAQGGATTTELEKATGLVGNSFYSALKRVRGLNLVDKGEKRTDPLTITGAGRARLSVESTNPEHQSGGIMINAAPPFEVNAHLDQLLPLLPGSNELLPNEAGSSPQLLPKGSGSNDGSNEPETDPSESASYQVATNTISVPDAVTTTATKLLPNTSGSNDLLTTTSLSPLGEGVGSNRSSNGVEHDQRREAEVDKFLREGNVKAARRAAGYIHGRKEGLAALQRIEDYEEAHYSKVATS